MTEKLYLECPLCKQAWNPTLGDVQQHQRRCPNCRVRQAERTARQAPEIVTAAQLVRRDAALREAEEDVAARSERLDRFALELNERERHMKAREAQFAKDAREVQALNDTDRRRALELQTLAEAAQARALRSKRYACRAWRVVGRLALWVVPAWGALLVLATLIARWPR